MEEYKISLKKIILENFIPMFISVLLTAILTWYVTNLINDKSYEKEVRYIALQTLKDITTIVSRAEQINGLTVDDDFVTLNINQSDLSINNRLKLLEFLTEDELYFIIDFFNQANSINQIMDLYNEAVKTNNVKLISSYKKVYIDECARLTDIYDEKQGDNIMSKLECYSKVKIVNN